MYSFICFFMVGWVFMVRDAKNSDEVFKSQEFVHGFLFCQHCQGYYPLKENENPEDFKGCECGSSLEFYSDWEEVLESIDKTSNTNITAEDYLDIENLLKVLKTKNKTQKELLNELSKRSKVQKALLEDIMAEKWALWDVLPDESPQLAMDDNHIADFKRQQEYMFKLLKEQRARAQSPTSSWNWEQVKPETKLLSILLALFILVLIIFSYILLTS